MKSPKHVTNKDYVVCEDLPLDQKELFYDWLSQEPIKTTPVIIEEEIKRQKWVLCAYVDDYDYFYNVVFNPAIKIKDDDK